MQVKQTRQSNVNSFVWITSLRENEIGISRRILEDLTPLLNSLGVAILPFDVKSVKDMKWLMTSLSFRVQQGMRMLIHLDMHGDKDGLKIAKTGEIYSWSEFCSTCSIINSLQQNELLIVSTACFGLRMLEGINPLARCPFSCLIAPEREISAGYLESSLPRFYEELFRTRIIEDAFKNTFQKPFRIFSSHDLFLVLMCIYYADHCSGAAKHARREHLLSKAVEAGRVRNAQEIKHVRTHLKKALAFDEALVAKYAKLFLGPKDNFTLSLDLIKQKAQERNASKLKLSKMNKYK